MTRRRFEFEEDGSRKFWEVSVEGPALTVRFGRIGTDGQTKTKTLDSAEAADRESAKLVTEKTRKGYREVTDAAAFGGASPVAPADEANAAPAKSAPTVEASAPSAKPKKAAKTASWKPFTVNGVHLAIAPSGTFAVVASAPMNVDGAFKSSLTIHERSGATRQIPLPGLLRGLAVFEDGRIVASIAEDYPARSPRTYEHAGVAIFDASGALLRAIGNPEYAGAQAVTVDRTNGRIAFRAMPMDTAHPRYLQARVVVLDPNAPEKATVLDFGTSAPVFGFDDEGVLLAFSGKRGVRVDRDGTAHELPEQDSAISFPANRLDHLGLSASANRVALVGHLDAVRVVENGAVKFSIPVNICERVFLVDSGRTLVTAASATKARLGPGALEVAQWPDPDPVLREANLAAWDVETGRLKKAVALGGPNLNSVAIAEGECFAVNTTGRAIKVEFVPWSALLRSADLSD